MYTCIRRGKAPTVPRQATILRCRLALKLRLEQVRTCIKQTMYAMIDRRACPRFIVVAMVKLTLAYLDFTGFIKIVF